MLCVVFNDMEPNDFTPIQFVNFRLKCVLGHEAQSWRSTQNHVNQIEEKKRRCVAIAKFSQEAHPKAGQARHHPAIFKSAVDILHSRNLKTPLTRHYTWCCKNLSVPGQRAKWAKCAQNSNCWALSFVQKLAHGQRAAHPTIGGLS